MLRTDPLSWKIRYDIATVRTAGIVDTANQAEKVQEPLLKLAVRYGRLLPLRTRTSLCPCVHVCHTSAHLCALTHTDAQDRALQEMKRLRIDISSSSGLMTTVHVNQLNSSSDLSSTLHLYFKQEHIHMRVIAGSLQVQSSWLSLHAYFCQAPSREVCVYTPRFRDTFAGVLQRSNVSIAKPCPIKSDMAYA